MKASDMVDLAKFYIGYNEKDGSHKVIVDRYNTQKELPMGYELKYNDQWCAAFVSALALELGFEQFPYECSCPRMIRKLKKMDCWVEDDAYYPGPGTLIFYNWSDHGIFDNRGEADHVGIVEKVVGNRIFVIEGNYHHAVKRREIVVDGQFIRGFGKLPYEKEIQVGDRISYHSYKWGNQWYNESGKGLVVYIMDDFYVVDEAGSIKLVNKINLE